MIPSYTPSPKQLYPFKHFVFILRTMHVTCMKAHEKIQWRDLSSPGISDVTLCNLVDVHLRFGGTYASILGSKT